MGSPIFPPSSGGSGSGTSDHSQLTNRTAANQHPGSSISLDTTNFDNNLSTSDDTVQKAMETIDAMSGGGGTGITWNNVTSTSQTASINNGYIANNASLVTITLPTTAPVGSMVPVVGSGAGGWKIAQNSGQYIVYGDVSSTVGTSGYIASVYHRDCIELICTVENTEFQVISWVGTVEVA